nr:RcOsp3 [Ceratobasidium cereale]
MLMSSHLFFFLFFSMPQPPVSLLVVPLGQYTVGGSISTRLLCTAKVPPTDQMRTRCLIRSTLNSSWGGRDNILPNSGVELEPIVFLSKYPELSALKTSDYRGPRASLSALPTVLDVHYTLLI